MRIDHVAQFCRDPRRTHDFYGRVLGLRLTQAYAGRQLMLLYDLPGGGGLAFTARRNVLENGPPANDREWERSHVGLTVATRLEFDGWQDRLKQHAVEHRVVDDERIYFADPDGLVLEIEVESPIEPNPKAEELLERWLKEKVWDPTS